ncbi:hypothetical protein HV011_13830 [Citrobacter freundii]|uniref:hypothetical protein n=1 Tax=Citrobacter freundii TaxID=546 RepID=UPI0015E8ED76|nr:hypothetical protein [Citrobacter freundii]QMB06609.1 hypothetical protein HV011_13830 [Citrobacter freundii]
MPYKSSIADWFTQLMGNPPEWMKLLFIVVLGELARWMYGGGRIRERCADAITCVLLFYLVRPWIPQLPLVMGVKILPGSVAIILALVGGSVCAGILAWVFEMKTGIKVWDKKKDR